MVCKSDALLTALLLRTSYTDVFNCNFRLGVKIFMGLLTWILWYFIMLFFVVLAEVVSQTLVKKHGDPLQWLQPNRPAHSSLFSTCSVGDYPGHPSDDQGLFKAASCVTWDHVMSVLKVKLGGVACMAINLLLYYLFCRAWNTLLSLSLKDLRYIFGWCSLGATSSSTLDFLS